MGFAHTVCLFCEFACFLSSITLKYSRSPVCFYSLKENAHGVSYTQAMSGWSSLCGNLVVCGVILRPLQPFLSHFTLMSYSVVPLFWFSLSRTVPAVRSDSFLFILNSSWNSLSLLTLHSKVLFHLGFPSLNRQLLWFFGLWSILKLFIISNTDYFWSYF